MIRNIKKGNYRYFNKNPQHFGNNYFIKTEGN
jgi:hypothetical protein